MDFGRYISFLSLVAALALNGACSGKVSISTSKGASQDSSFLISVPESVEIGKSFLISWTRLEGATYSLALTRAEDCSEEVIRFSNLGGTEQEAMITENSDYHVCLKAELEGEEILPENNGVRLSLAGNLEVPVLQPSATNKPTNERPEFEFLVLQKKASKRSSTQSFDISWQIDDIDSDPLYEIGYGNSDQSDCNILFDSRDEKLPGNDLALNLGSMDSGEWFLCARIVDGEHDFEVWSAFPFVVNSAPEFSWKSLVDSDDLSGEAVAYSGLEWDASDQDDEAGLSVFYSTSVKESCVEGQLVGESLSVGVSQTTIWDTTGVAPGAYYFCARMDDGFDAIEVWTDHKLIINDRPEFVFSAPAVSNSRAANGGTFNISWNDSDQDNDATISLYYHASMVNPCETGTVIASGLSEDDVTNQVSLDVTPLAPGEYFICATIEDGVNPAQSVWAGSSLSVNTVPDLVFVAPVLPIPVIPENATYMISWTDSDPDPGDNAAITLYYASVASGPCSDGNLIGTTTEDAADSFSWDTTGVSHGFYFVCARIEDGLNSYEVWSSSSIQINDAPWFNFATPGNYSVDEFMIGQSINVTWNDSDDDNDAAIVIYRKTTDTGACNLGTPIANGLSENAANTFSYDTTGLAQGVYFLCAIINDNVNPPLERHSSEFAIFTDCTWDGSTDTVWTDPTNWSGCNGSIPQVADKVLIPPGGNQPIISASTSIGGFVASTVGGGTITINSGVTLDIRDQGQGVASDISFVADSATCEDCYVRFGFSNKINDLHIVNGATLTVNEGISLVAGAWLSEIKVGDGASEGHFATGPRSDDPARWPKYIGGTNRYHIFLTVEGTATNRSTVSIDGLIAKDMKSNQDLITFVDNFEIISFDNLSLETELDDMSASYIRFVDCTTAVMGDLLWNNITFVDKLAGNNFYNIDFDGTNCDNLSPFIVEGTGSGWGESWDADPFNRITWNPSPSEVCVWNGAVSNDWLDENNWTMCTNLRGGFPDRWSWVEIPSAPVNQPRINGNREIFGFHPGSGGGTITIEQNTELTLYGDISSSISFIGDDTSSATRCNNCVVARRGSSNSYENLAVVNGATLAIGTELALRLTYDSQIHVGTSLSPGHFEALGGTDVNLWPMVTSLSSFHSGIVVGGGVSGNSTIVIDGFNMDRLRSSNGYGIRFVDYYGITTLNNLFINTTGGGFGGSALIGFDSCTNGTTTNIWDGMEFIPSLNPGSWNIDLSDPSCVAFGPIDLSTATGPGSGPGLENDPFDLINW